jgi:hypothetical protein
LVVRLGVWGCLGPILDSEYLNVPKKHIPSLGLERKNQGDTKKVSLVRRSSEKESGMDKGDQRQQL